MTLFFGDYFWKGGRPIGKGVAGAISYRIITDPYQKWISIEEYKEGCFSKIIYDSRFLDFRKLKPIDQLAWRKEITEEGALIFNEDDRLILKESYHFRDDLCCRIHIYSPYQSLICFYEMPDGPFGPVQLYDANSHCVMQRLFEEKTKVLKELWDMSPVLPQ